MKKLIIALVVLGSCTKITRPSVAWKIPKEYCLATNGYGQYRIADREGHFLARGMTLEWTFDNYSMVYTFQDSLVAKEALIDYVQKNTPFTCK